MNEKHILFTFFFVMGLIHAQAQSDTVLISEGTITINGKVIDKEENEGLPFANVEFYLGEEKVKTVQSDFDGEFSAQIDTTGISETLSLEISYTGYLRFELKEIPLKTDYITLKLETDEGIDTLVYVHDFVRIEPETFKINGKVIDKETKEEIPFANVVFYLGEEEITIAQSDFDGKFRTEMDITEIRGTLSLQVSYTGYSRFELTEIPLKSLYYTLELGKDDGCCIIEDIFINIIDISETTTGATYSSDDIMNGAW